MYDTTHFRLYSWEKSEVDFLSEIPCYLADIGEHHYPNGIAITGTMENFKVSISKKVLNIKDGSLTKFLKGNNAENLTRSEARQAIEKMSDCLHISIHDAKITRLDVGANIDVKHPVPAYLYYMGAMTYAKRLQQPQSIYYTAAKQVMCLYDKFAEMRKRHEEIPQSVSAAKHLFRYEMRVERRLPQFFNVQEVTGKTLYEDAFCDNVCKLWKEKYFRIKKIKTMDIDLSKLSSTKDLSKYGIIALAHEFGGQQRLLDFMEVQRQIGNLTPKQLYDMKRVINNAFSTATGTATESLIAELDAKINEFIFY